MLSLIERIQNDQDNWEQEVPVDDDPGVAGGEVIMLDHVKDVGEPRSQHKNGFRDDEWQPERPVPEAEEPCQANSN